MKKINNDNVAAVGNDDQLKQEFDRLNPGEGATINSSQTDEGPKVGTNVIPKKKIKMILGAVAALAIIFFITGLAKDPKTMKKATDETEVASIPTYPQELIISDSDRVMERDRELPVQGASSISTLSESSAVKPAAAKSVPQELRRSHSEKAPVSSNPPVSAAQSAYWEPVNNTAQENRSMPNQEEDFSDIFAVSASPASAESVVYYPSQTSSGQNYDINAGIKEQYRSDYNRQNMQDEKQAWVEGKANEKNVHVLSAAVEQPIADTTIHQGSVIPIILISGINSDLPGQIVGRVLQDVYSSVDGKHLVIPAGSSVSGEYNSAVSFGQKRVLVAWQRLIRPDGTSIDLKGMGGADLQGYAGYSDKVDWHYKEISQLVGLTTMLNIGASSINATSMSGVLRNAITGAADDTQDIVSEIAKKVINVQPTITIRPLTKCNIMVNKDIVLPPYDLGQEE